MTEIKEFDTNVIQSKLTFRVCLEFKMNHANWEAEIEVVRTEEENYLNHEFKILNTTNIPPLNMSDRRELYQYAQDKVDELVRTGQI